MTKNISSVYAEYALTPLIRPFLSAHHRVVRGQTVRPLAVEHRRVRGGPVVVRFHRVARVRGRAVAHAAAAADTVVLTSAGGGVAAAEGEQLVEEEDDGHEAAGEEDEEQGQEHDLDPGQHFQSLRSSSVSLA